ncbi:Transducin/WD40 repeat-like superfamily protein [Hibiscus syriacus]|uniref:Transducin/WD40 repeat-like superfamily protein n=1 Tax=Hibiscus syriacus TaxID=106335 RepID=A0A6A2YBQ9_HIBSY|nr:Transducin/WD40 repeat-like superfamily protein [Hibiscus syriacus]
MDPKSGFCQRTRTDNCLRSSSIPLPPIDQPLSVSEFCLQSSTSGATTFAVNATTGESLAFSQFFSQVRSLAYSLQQRYSLSYQNDIAFSLSSPSIRVPVTYFALLSLGIIVSSANPLSSDSEIAHQIQLSNPVVAFATSETSHKISPLKHGTILLDSPEFISLLTQSDTNDDAVKTVKMAVTSFFDTNQGESNEEPRRSVTFFTVPLFHVFGFFMLLAAVLSANSVVMLARLNLEEMLRAVEKYKVTGMPVSPPLVLAFVKSELTKKYDLNSLQGLGCGGAALGEDIAQRFNEIFPINVKFPSVLLVQLTEQPTLLVPRKQLDTIPSAPRRKYGSEDSYVGDEKATAETLDSEGWLRTGDICYFDYDKSVAYRYVPPAELEHLILSHPKIADAAVIPYPDDEAGQIPMAYAVRNPGSSIIEARVAPYKKIRTEISVREDLEEGTG